MPCDGSPGARPPCPGVGFVPDLKYLYYLLLPEVQKARNYGGVVVWDRYSDKRTGYSGVVKGWA